MADEEQFTQPKTSTPVIPQAKEPPPEVLKQEFKLDPNFDSSSDPTRITTEDQQGTTKAVKLTDQIVTPVEEKKEEPKVEEKKEISPVLKPPSEEKKVEGEKKEVIKPIVPPSKEKVTRDYSGYSDEAVAHFKQMSDSAYKYVSDLIKQTKELSALKDASFLQHPEAYTLSPDYKNMQSEISFAFKEGNYWKEMLNKVKKGEAVVPLTGWDEKGNPILGSEVPASAEVEEAVRAAMNNCYSVAGQKQGSLSQVGKTFQDRVKNDLQMIQQERSSRFGWVSDPKLLDYVLPIDGLGDMSIKQIKQTFTEMFPPYLRSNPGVEVASDLFVALRIQQAELAQALNGKQTEKIKEDDAKRAEPTSDARKVEQKIPAGKVREFSLAGLPT